MTTIAITASTITANSAVADITVTMTGYGPQSTLSAGLFHRASDNTLSTETLTKNISKSGMFDLAAISEVITTMLLKFSEESDQATLSEIIFIGISPSKYDLVTFSQEQLSFSTDKTLLDTHTLSEILRYSMAKVLTDASIFSEDLAKHPMKVLQEAIGVSESVSTATQYYRSFSDLVTVFEFTDIPVSETSFSENSTIAELATFNIGIAKPDTAIISELLSMQLDSIRSDIFSNTDIITILSGKVAADSVTQIEALVAYKQDYFLSDYVTPGYVGTITTL